MYSGDEIYGDDITSGPWTEDMDPEPDRFCPDCRRRITTAWNGGRCLDCHEARLGPDPCGPGCDIDCPHS